MDFSTLFSNGVQHTSYKLVDPKHPLEFYVGYNDKGLKTFVFVSKTKIENLSGTKCIDVEVIKTDFDYKLFISLENNEMFDLYCKLLSDIFESTRHVSNKIAGAKEVCNRYLKWRAFFYAKKDKKLSDEEAMGLIGELLFLKKLFTRMPKRQAIDSWSGCELTHKDFAIGNLWYEIKTTAVSSDSVHISSLEQLDSDTDGILVVYSVEKMSQEFDGISIKKIYNSLIENLDKQSDKDLLTDKIVEAGWNPLENNSKQVYRLVGKKAYSVTCDFPRITHKTISKAISKAEYCILKTQIKDFEVNYEQL